MAQTSSLTGEQLTIAARLSAKLNALGINCSFVEPVVVGPIVSTYKFMPRGSTRVSHIEALAKDLALALGLEDDVLVKRMPGEEAVGIFVPNAQRKWVMWRDIVGTVNKVNGFEIPLLLGIDNLGDIQWVDLASLPHLLIAGSTGGGKSTLLNEIISTLIYSKSPNEVELVLSDTKGVEFLHYIGAPHLVFDPATTVYRTLEQIDWVLTEMDGRFKRFAKYGKRNILEYNSLGNDKIPHTVVIIDELFDLLSNRSKPEEDRGPSIGKIFESKLQTLVQKGRATGIHVIAATQRPDVKVVAGNIKANFPARLSFRLTSEADSRTVLATSGAQHLLSRGDMLFINPNSPAMRRIHAPLASMEDVKAAVELSLRRQQ